MQRGSVQLLLILLFIVIVIFGGFYFYQKTKVTKALPAPELPPVKQSEFNDYSNLDLGFKFQYAKNLTVKEDSEEEYNKRGNGNFRKNFKGYVGYEPGKFLGAVTVLDKSNSFDINPFSVWVFNNDDNLTIDAWFKNYWYYPFLWGVFDWSSKGHVTPDLEATISGQLAKYKIVTYQPGKPKFLYVSKNQKMYLFRVIGEEGEKVLSSLKFNSEK
ncbi:hypothetical protein HYU94_02975 [Candidatus Daviesbacteria bacterium]|nr:hypothetical protein [Candidatus Daviesbacteria bacterium]